MQPFFVAFDFLTIVPLPAGAVSPADVRGSRHGFAAIGLILGAVLGGMTAVIAGRLTPPIASLLIVCGWVILTGGLHLDGWCDLWDAFAGGWTVEDRLRIMKDPHLGTAALAAGGLLLLGKHVLVSELLRRDPVWAGWWVGLAVVLARCLVTCVAAGARYPRPDGTGKLIIESTRGWEGVVAGAVALAVGSCLGIPGLCAAAAGLTSVVVLRRSCQRRLGGVTGDCLGAGIELVEIVVLLVSSLVPPAG